MNNPELNKSKPLVSVVVPAYNEEQILEPNLAKLCAYLKSLENEFLWELIIINDGSTDATGEIAEAFAADRENVCVLHHMFNFRLGQALRFALTRCNGDYIVVMDADLSYSPDHIGKMLAKIRDSRAKIVIASPYTKGGRVSHVPWLRKILSKYANRFLSLLTTRDWYSDKLTNLTGMVRTYDGEFLRTLSLWAMDVDINPEIVYKAKILRARIVEIPAHLDWSVEKTSRQPSQRRRSSFRIMHGILQSFLSGFIFRPFIFFIFPGLLLFVLSLYPLIWALVHTINFYKRFAHLIPFDNRLSQAMGAAYKLAPHSFIVGGIALLVSIQLISLGFLAYQKKRYFVELFNLGSSIYKDLKSTKKTGII
jgi:glycosyltransferase involved in cell wall biosynthesis